MNDEMLEKFKRQIGESNTFLIGEDEFCFEPLPAMLIPEYMWIIQRDLNMMSDIERIKFDEEGNIVEDKRRIKDVEGYQKETMGVTVKLIRDMISKSYPELPEEFKDKFITKNYFRLQEILFTINGDVGLNKIDKNKLEQIKQLREKVNNGKLGPDKK